MNDISLTDILYTGSMLFVVFYGALFITNLISKYANPVEEEEEEEK
jgi:hypothetical protein